MLNLTLNNGETVDLTMNMAALYKLRTIRPAAYKSYNSAMATKKGQESDTLDTILNALYMGYLCGMLKKDKLNESKSFSEFLELLPEDMTLIMETGGQLINPKRRRDSENLSEEAPKSENGAE